METSMTDTTTTAVWGKATAKHGKPPAILLMNPKYPRNVGMAIRLASCYGMNQVWFTGKRFSLDTSQGQRLPREERMKGYRDVELIHHDYPFDQFERGVTPVAIEVRENAVPLPLFEHPENPLYVFGPEDGSIDQVTLRHCHSLIVIPTRHCLNLATAISTVLWDREQKLWTSSKKSSFTTPGAFECRGFDEFSFDENGEPTD